MHKRGIRPLLIKGPAVAAWLYDDPAERWYGDVDLLVDPELFDAAGDDARRARVSRHEPGLAGERATRHRRASWHRDSGSRSGWIFTTGCC